MVRLPRRFTLFRNTIESLFHQSSYFKRMINNDLIKLTGLFTERRFNESIYLIEIGLAACRTCKNKRHLHAAVLLLKQNAQHVENLFRCTCTARKDNDAMTQPNKGL